MDQMDATDEVSPEMAKTFALAYVRLSQQSRVGQCKHLVSYLVGHESICISLKWKGQIVFYLRDWCVDERFQQPCTSSLTAQVPAAYSSAKGLAECATYPVDSLASGRDLQWLYQVAYSWCHESSRYRHQEPPASRMRSVMSLLGMYNVATGAAEGVGPCFEETTCDDDSKRVGPTERMRRE